ncbi:MAG: glucuronate isomerase [Acidimicrobiales bacterium]
MTTAHPPTFLGDDFLLSTPIARELYHDHAAPAPIVDVHNHLPADEIADDAVAETITDLWLGGDHYKWRAMRLHGVPEELISGAGDPWEKFRAWAATVPQLVRNPLYVWTHLELKRAFGIDTPLTPSSARSIYDAANEQLPELGARRLLRQFGVELVATTDEPGSDLAHHERLAALGEDGLRMVPTFRPDAAHALLGDPGAWNRWVDGLLTSGDATTIDDLASLLGALESSYARMAAAGGRASDHGLARLPPRPRDPGRADEVVRAARSGQPATNENQEIVMLEVVALAARLAHADDGVLQLHLGPIRNASPRLLDLVGRDAGADVMGDERQADGLALFLGDLERAGELPRTVLYNLNPADNALLVTMAGAFARPGVAGLVQWGPPWWFNDHESGMRRQLDDLSQIGQLGGFIGMLTDSRSILSMTRHELFRRILCDVVGRDVEAGTIPADIESLGALVRAVSVDNARAFFGY